MNNPPSPPTTPAQVFLAAHDYIENRGWTQRAYEREGGAACLWKAVNIVADKLLLKECYRLLLLKECYRLLCESPEILSLPLAYQTPITWNDVDHRTSREVLDLLWRLGHDEGETSLP